MKKILITISFLAAGYLAMAQTPDLDSVKMELYKINKIFDSSRYLGFDVGIVYSSDTILGKYGRDEIKGNYILNERNIYYKMGNTEYIQNDSFVYSIYHNEKMLMMTKNAVQSTSELFPIKEFVDSIITWYDTSYIITLRDEDDSRVIEFTARTSGLPYKRFAVYYDEASHYPNKFEMSFTEGFNELPNDVPDSIAALIKVRQMEKKITMTFSNYHSPPTLDIFRDENYVYFDRLRKRYQPSDKLVAYQFVANGVGQDEYDESIEVYPPPTNGN